MVRRRATALAQHRCQCSMHTEISFSSIRTSSPIICRCQTFTTCRMLLSPPNRIRHMMDHIKSEGKQFYLSAKMGKFKYAYLPFLHSYSGNSSPTQGTKTYRNIQRDRQFNANRKPNTYSKSMGNLPKSQSPPDRFLQRLDSIELQPTAPESLCNQSVWDDLSQCIWEKCVER